MRSSLILFHTKRVHSTRIASDIGLQFLAQSSGSHGALRLPDCRDNVGFNSVRREKDYDKVRESKHIENHEILSSCVFLRNT